MQRTTPLKRALSVAAALAFASCFALGVLATASVAFAAGGPSITTPLPAPVSTIPVSNPILSASVADDVALNSAAALTVDGGAYPMGVVFSQADGHWVDTGYDYLWVMDYDYTHGALARQLTGLADGSHAATLTVTDTLGRSTSRGWSFTVATPPVFSAFSPAAGTSTSPSIPTITAHYDGASQAIFSTSVDGIGVAYTYTAATKVVSFKPSKALPNGTTHTVAVTCLSTSPRKTSTWTFTEQYGMNVTVVNMLPSGTVLSAMPALSAAVTSDVDMTAVKLILDSATLTPSLTFGSGGTDKRHATVSGTSSMLADGPHTASLTVSTASGTTTPTTWAFRVASPPVITTVSPVEVSSVFTTMPAIVASILDNGGAILGTFTLDGKAVAGTWDPVVKTISLPLATPLSNDETHVVALTVTDAGGLSASKSWSFGVQIYSDGYATSMCTSAGCHSTMPGAHPVPADCHECHHAEDATMTACFVCHTSPQPHTSSVFTGVVCTSCHEPAVPSTPQHPAGSNEALHLTSLDMTSCKPCHVRSLSIEHARRLDKTGQPMGCRTCHDSKDVLVAAAIGANNTSCYGCHLSADHESSHVTTLAAECQGCHAASLTSEHITTRKLTCDTCHASPKPEVLSAIATGQTACVACHPTASVSHYDSVDHTATLPPQDIAISGVDYGTHACSECHSARLGDLHSLAGKPNCATCHPTPRGTFTTWSFGCVQGGCHSVGSTAPMHANIDTTHAVTPASAGCLTGGGCHAGANLAALHSKAATTTVAGRVLTSCAVCHAAGVPSSRECASCHADKSPVPINHFPAATHVSASGPGCSDCHSLDLATEHAKASSGSVTCTGCHTSSKFAALARPWNGTCSACHGADHALGVSFCQGCHATARGTYAGAAVYDATKHGNVTTSVSALTVWPGTSYAAGSCVNCHGSHTATPRAAGNALCLTCHDAAGTTKPATRSYQGAGAYGVSGHGGLEGSRTVSTHLGPDSAGFEAWESVVQPSPSSPGTVMSPAAKSAMLSQDASRAVTSLARVDNGTDYQMYRFMVPSGIPTQLNANWSGFGEMVVGYPVGVSIWNTSFNGGAGGWELIRSQQMTNETALSAVETTSTHVTSDGYVYLMAQALNLVDTKLISAPVVSATTTRTATVSWVTQGFADSWVDFGRDASWGSVAGSATLSQAHTVVLPLTGPGFYHLRARSTSRDGDTYASSDMVLGVPGPLAKHVPDATVVGSGPVALTWAAPAGAAGLFTYQVHIWDGLTFDQRSAWQSATSLTMTLTSGNYYHWQVEAKDSSGMSYGSSTADAFWVWEYSPPSGSCPFLFTWDGSKYVFEGDLYAAGKLATKTKVGYLKPNPYDAWVLKNVPVSKDGSLEVKLVEERYEADYLDQLKLYTLDVPADRQVVSKTPVQATAFNGVSTLLHTVSRNLTPVVSAVRTDTGEDVTAQLSATDGNYVVLSNDRNLDFDYKTLELDLGGIQSAGTVKIIMDAITAFPKSPEGTARSATFGARTKIEVQNATGAWVGVPSSTFVLPKPGEFDRMFAFDISKIWISDSRKVRFTYLFKTYVDSIFVDTTPDVPVTLTEVPLTSAVLAQHGYDATTTPAEVYKYQYGAPVKAPQYFPGAYTKLGDVTPLLASADDKFVVYGGGDELTLRFAPPADAPGGNRQYLMYTDGFYKDNLVDVTHTVDPMPFHAMSNFPYAATESYPTDADHLAYLSEWNTRVVTATYGLSPSDPIYQFWSGQLAALTPPSGQPGVTVTEFPPPDGAAAHRSLNTDYVGLEVATVGGQSAAGACSTCHAVHGKVDPATGRMIADGLNDTEVSLCTGGGKGACHSVAGNSVSGVDIAARLAASSDASAHHGLGAASTSGMKCSSCHDAHSNNAANKYSDPAAIGTPMASNLDKYLDPSGRLYVLVGAQHDGAAPVISGIVRDILTGSHVRPTLSWTTNEAGTTRVDLGTTPSFEMGAFGSDTLVTSHSSTLPTLTVGTTYFYRLRSADALGNTAMSVVATYAPTGPVISSAVVDTITSGTMQPVILWSTDEAATTWVDWGTTTAYASGSVGSSAPLSTTHSVSLPILSLGTPYCYRIRSADVAGNLSILTGTYTPASIVFPVPAPTITTAVPTLHVNGTYGQVSVTATLTWNAVINPNGNALQYQAYVNGAPQGWTTSTSSAISVGADGYSWYVVARDAVYPAYISPASGASTFSVIDDNPPASSSCPDLYSWDANAYRYVTDVMGLGSLGLRVGPGAPRYPHPEEDSRIDPSLLVAQGGVYKLSLRENRDELDYIDKLSLRVIDHPIGTKVYLSDFAGAYASDSRQELPPNQAYTVGDLAPVVSASYTNIPLFQGTAVTDQDITSQVSTADSVFAPASLFDDGRYTFDLGDLRAAPAIKMVMTGWTQYASPLERSTWLAAGAQNAEHTMEVQDASGIWVKICDVVPFIPGMKKTVVYDLTGKFPAGVTDYKVRLRGFVRTWIDSVGVDTTPQADTRVVELKPSKADLQYVGPGARLVTDGYPQYDAQPTGTRHFHTGDYTRYGDVSLLLNSADDKFVVMDTGDGVSLEFPAVPVQPGMERTYVLHTDGYFKEHAAATVSPLPFHAMSNYPYPSTEQYPTDTGHQSYITDWNTRHHDAGQVSALPVLPVLPSATLASRFSTFLSSASAGLRVASLDAKPLAYSVDTDRLSLTLTTNNGSVSPVGLSAGWESAGSLPPTVASLGTPVTAAQLAKTATTDGTYWRTDLATADRSWNWQVAQYSVPTRNAAKNLLLQWTGHGEPTVGYPVALYLWNFKTSSWDQVANAPTPTDTLYASVQEDVSAAFCLRCHNGSTPAGITMPTTVKNVGAFWGSTGDAHGDGSSQLSGYSSGGLAAGYSRASSGIPCATCHDPHGSDNLDHIAAVVNGSHVTVHIRADFKNLCATCHTGGAYAWHQACNDCHTNPDSHGWLPRMDESQDCLACHSHGATYTHPTAGASCHCSPDGAKWKTF